MAFRKVLALALCCSMASAAPQLRFVQAASPQQVRFVQAGASPLATQSFLRAVPQVATVSHATHAVAAPTVVRTVQAAPTVVRTVQAAPVVSHVSHAAVAPVAVRTVEVEQVDNPNYSYGYSVADVQSGDSKTREEHSENGLTTGSYSVAQPDGRIRTVEYTADAENGFQATVSYDGDVNAPPAIPFDAPAPAVVSHAVAAAPATTIIAARNNLAATHVSHAALAPATTVVRANNVFSHAVAQPTVVRANAVHNIHNLAQPQTTFVRNVAAAQPVFHSVAAAQPTFVRANNVLSHNAFAAQPAVQSFRTIASPFATQQLVQHV